MKDYERLVRERKEPWHVVIGARGERQGMLYLYVLVFGFLMVEPTCVNSRSALVIACTVWLREKFPQDSVTVIVFYVQMPAATEHSLAKLPDVSNPLSIRGVLSGKDVSDYGVFLKRSIQQ